MNNKLYYTPPSNKVFEDLRTQSISLLETSSMVTDETSLEIRDRMIDGETNEMFINF